MSSSKSSINYGDLNSIKLITLSINNERYRAQLSRKILNPPKYISLGLKATKDNEREALTKCQLLENQIKDDLANDRFDNTLYKYRMFIKKDNFQYKKIQKASYWFNLFQDRYFDKKPKNPKTIRGFNKYVEGIRNMLRDYMHRDFTPELVEEIIKSTTSGTSMRDKTVNHLRCLCFYCDIKDFFDFRGWSGNYQPARRILPSDENLKLFFKYVQFQRVNQFGASIKDCPTNQRWAKSWSWIFGVLATYGLRPHELISIDFETSFQKPDYFIYLRKDREDYLKTGARVIPPIPKEWVKEFDLRIKDEKDFYTKTNCLRTRDNVNWKGFKRVHESISVKFRRVWEFNSECKIPIFRPYDLRHRYAIRGHEYGFPAQEMSRWMGHSLGEHETTYKKWMNDDSHYITYRAGLTRHEEIQAIREGKPSYQELESRLAEANMEIRMLRTIKELLDKQQ